MKICDIRILIWGIKFGPNFKILVSLESWRRDLFKFGKIKLNRSLNFKIENSSLGLKNQIENLTRVKNLKNSIFTEIENSIENQNSATVVYCNFGIFQNYQNQNFLKLIPVCGNKRYKIFSKIFKSIWTKISPKSIKISQNWLKSPKFWRKFLKLRVVHSPLQ